MPGMSDFFNEHIQSTSTDDIQDSIKNGSQWYVFVYDMINFKANTEKGIKPANANRNNFYQFTQIIQGEESVYLSPQGAISLNKVQGDGSIDPTTNKVKYGYYDVSYSKDNATVIKAMKAKNNGGNNFTSTNFGAFGDFTTISDQEKVSMLMTTKVSKEMLTKFYFIPDIYQPLANDNSTIGYSDNDIYYIQDYENYYNINGEYVYSQVTFSNIQFNLQQSGQTVEQHIYLNSPGGGYLIPQIIYDDDNRPVDWKWNEDFIADDGVKTIQLEISGNYAFGAVTVMGYPVDYDHNDINGKRVYAPRPLLIENFALPIKEDFYKLSSKTNNFYYVKAVLEATAEYGSYNQVMKDRLGDKKLDYQGMLSTSTDQAHKTNDVNKPATIQDRNFDCDNSTFSGNTVDTSYNNLFFTGYNNGKIGIGKPNFDMGDIWSYDSANKKQSIKDLFNIMSLAMIPVDIIPMETIQKLIWSLRDIPGVGGFLSKLTFNLPFYWRTITQNSNSLYPSLNAVFLLMSQNFYDFSSKNVYISSAVDENLNSKNTSTVFNPVKLTSSDTTADGGDGKVPLTFFQRKDSDTLGAIYGNKSNSTSLTFKITDKLNGGYYDESGNHTPNQQISTVMWNQQDANGNTYLVHPSDYVLTDSSNNGILTDLSSDKYVITGIVVKGIGDGDMRITTYNQDIDNIDPNSDFVTQIEKMENFQTIVKTQAQWKNDQIRDWSTIYNFSYLDSLDKYLNIPFNYPKPKPNIAPKLDVTDITQTNKGNTDNQWNGINGQYENYESDEARQDIDIFSGNRILQDYELLNITKQSPGMTWDLLRKEYTGLSVNVDNVTFTKGVVGAQQQYVGNDAQLTPLSLFLKPFDPYLDVMVTNNAPWARMPNKMAGCGTFRNISLYDNIASETDNGYLGSNGFLGDNRNAGINFMNKCWLSQSTNINVRLNLNDSDLPIWDNTKQDMPQNIKRLLVFPKQNFNMDLITPAWSEQLSNNKYKWNGNNWTSTVGGGRMYSQTNEDDELFYFIYRDKNSPGQMTLRICFYVKCSQSWGSGYCKKATTDVSNGFTRNPDVGYSICWNVSGGNAHSLLFDIANWKRDGGEKPHRWINRPIKDPSNQMYYTATILGKKSQ